MNDNNNGTIKTKAYCVFCEDVSLEFGFVSLGLHCFFAVVT